ncbi:hypothetical protein NIES2109_59420 (plasmid) [Nostoc sp. HK-01]|nr:hypothetical protein NIES2109_59420 [Nostoc sp. HK-01]
MLPHCRNLPQHEVWLTASRRARLRITQIYSDSLEETAKNLLQSLGKLNRPYLTVVEEKLLSVLESEYKER